MGSDADLELAMHGRDTPMFSFDGKEFVARVVAVHDADSIRVVYNTEHDGYKQLILRLYGIDAPEIRSHDAAEKQAAVCARDALLALVTGQEVKPGLKEKQVEALLEQQCSTIRVLCKSFEKYGRVLANLYALGDVHKKHSFNDALIQGMHAKPYFGKTKEAWTF